MNGQAYYPHNVSWWFYGNTITV